MKVSDDLRLAMEDGEAFNYRFEASPNFKPGFTPEHIMLYATERRDVQNQVEHFKQPRGISAHLIIGKDGKEIVQMGAFDLAAAHSMSFNKTALAVTLDYPGELTTAPNRFNTVDKFDPSQVLHAAPVRGPRIRPWPLYPKAQLDALLIVMQALLNKFETIKSILANDEVTSGQVDPGPAFPRTLFREKLLSGRGTLETLEETNQAVTLRAGPGTQFMTLFQNPLPKGTQVSVINDEEDWLLIEALTEMQGSPWVVGWVEKRFVSAKIYVPVVVDDMLHTQDGRRYLFIPAHQTNFEVRKTMLPPNPKYIVMHFTTGTQISSTINHFTTAFTASTHLLIGRDGRVIQFVPFNKSAHHVGLGFWENERDLNRMTIGIELDNAGYLSHINGEWLRRKTVIPPELVEEAVHWKAFRPRGWEKFTDVQLKVALDIVKALVKHYNIQDILGHDMVNLLNRTDPGPLFPIEDWRQEIYGRREPDFKPHHIADSTGKTPIFANPQGVPPDFIPEPGKKSPLELKGSPLENGTLVRILEKKPRWTLIFVFPNQEKKVRWMEGWVKTDVVKPVNP